MREMKDSGIAWIGSIPNSWQLSRVSYHYDTLLGKMVERNNQDIESDSSYLCAANIKWPGIDMSVHRHMYFTQYEKRQYLLQKDDILVMEGGATSGTSCLYKGEFFPCYMQNSIIRCRAKRNEDSRFLYYWLYIVYYGGYIDATCNQATFRHFTKEKVDKTPFLAVSFSEQQSIAAYLDAKCAEIDTLTADIQTQIDTLEQYKRSVITEAVTKGLNPDVEMKESGAGWIGDIPAHWGFTKIDVLYSLRTEKVSDYDYAPLSVTMNGIVPQLETAAKTNAHDDRKLVRKGDFAINSRSDRRGSCGISDYDGSVSLINTVLTPKEDMNPRYYNWLFHTTEFADEFYKWGHGIVDDLWTTNWQDMRNIILPTPPLPEQQEIATYLDAKVSKISSIITAKREQLATLADYKKSLIFEYVTGKKEVPTNG